MAKWGRKRLGGFKELALQNHIRGGKYMSTLNGHSRAHMTKFRNGKDLTWSIHGHLFGGLYCTYLSLFQL